MTNSLTPSQQPNQPSPRNGDLVAVQSYRNDGKWHVGHWHDRGNTVLVGDMIIRKTSIVRKVVVDRRIPA